MHRFGRSCCISKNHQKIVFHRRSKIQFSSRCTDNEFTKKFRKACRHSVKHKLEAKKKSGGKKLRVRRGEGRRRRRSKSILNFARANAAASDGCRSWKAPPPLQLLSLPAYPLDITPPGEYEEITAFTRVRLMLLLYRFFSFFFFFLFFLSPMI